MQKILVFILTAILLVSNASAASIIRDAEIEHVIRKIANPIFRAADLQPESINIYIINDSDINAYVAGGRNVFLNTGLIGMSDDSAVLAGVIAHETGHIAGGHLLKGSKNIKDTTIKATLGYVLGLAAAAAGSPQAGIAIASGAGHVAQRQLLKHTRSSEEQADQAALSYLDKTGQSASGLLELLEVLYSNEITIYGELNPYTLTHPLSRKRISYVKRHLQKNPSKETPALFFKRASVKLNAFLDKYEVTLKKFPKSDNSVVARYARAIAYYKVPDIKKSLHEIDLLLTDYPNEPFFNELKGQILFENGRIQESIKYYNKANDFIKNSALIKISLATAQISAEDEGLLPSAINNLEQALIIEKNNVFAWRQLAIAYGRSGDLAMSNIALAEEALRLRKKQDVNKFAELAKPHIKPGSPADLRLQDIQALVKNSTDSH